MSGSVYYAAVRKGTNIPCDTPSKFRSAMESVYGQNQPWPLTKLDVPTLTTMAKLSDSGSRQTFESIISSLERVKCGEINVWMEY